MSKKTAPAAVKTVKSRRHTGKKSKKKAPAPTAPKKPKVSANDVKHIMPVVVRLLKTAKGPKKGVNNTFIRRYIKGQAGVDVHPRMVQAVLHEIRTLGLVKCVMAGQDGYYIATSAGMAEGYERALISRLREQTQLLEAFRGQATQKFGHYWRPPKRARAGRASKNLYDLAGIPRPPKRTDAPKYGLYFLLKGPKQKYYVCSMHTRHQQQDLMRALRKKYGNKIERLQAEKYTILGK